MPSVVNGNYQLCFLPTKAGTQYLDIRINAIPLQGSPVSMVVQPGSISAAYSQVRDANVCPSTCTSPTLSVSTIAGVPKAFTIVPRYLSLSAALLPCWPCSCSEFFPSLLFSFFITSVTNTKTRSQVWLGSHWVPFLGRPPKDPRPTRPLSLPRMSFLISFKNNNNNTLF